MATGFLPVALLKNNFRAFVACPESRQLKSEHPALVNFIQYLEDTYVGETAPFGPPLWCVYERTMDNRSNNAVEGKKCRKCRQEEKGRLNEK